jgi:hypothetical protein
MLAGLTLKTDATERLRKFVLALGPAYPIVAVLPVRRTARRALVKYEQTIIPKPEITSLSDRLRLLLGLRPYQAGIPVDPALTCQSYHLQVKGPADQYLAQQYLWCWNCKKLMRRNWYGTVPSMTDGHGNGCAHQESADDSQDRHFRLQGRHGQDFAHLYMRGYAGSGLQNIELLTRFAETPPGTLANAAVTSAAAAILIGAVGWIVSHGGSPHGSDVPALVLALPAIAVSWFGFISDTESVLRSSLAARVSLICSGLVSLASAIAFLTGVHDVRDPSTRQLNVLGVTDTYWILLLFLATINLAGTCHLYFMRSNYYHLLLRRPEKATASPDGLTSKFRSR